MRAAVTDTPINTAALIALAQFFCTATAEIIAIATALLYLKASSYESPTLDTIQYMYYQGRQRFLAQKGPLPMPGENIQGRGISPPCEDIKTRRLTIHMRGQGPSPSSREYGRWPLPPKPLSLLTALVSPCFILFNRIDEVLFVPHSHQD